MRSITCTSPKVRMTASKRLTIKKRVLGVSNLKFVSNQLKICIKSTQIYIYIYIYIYVCVCVCVCVCVLKKELLRLFKIKILYKKNKPKIKKRRYMKYFGYILTFINHTVH